MEKTLTEYPCEFVDEAVPETVCDFPDCGAPATHGCTVRDKDSPDGWYSWSSCPSHKNDCLKGVTEE